MYSPIKRAVISNSRHHDHSIGSQFPHLLNKGLVQEIWPPNAQIEDIDAFENGIVEGIQEPRCVGDLQQHKEEVSKVFLAVSLVLQDIGDVQLLCDSQ